MLTRQLRAERILTDAGVDAVYLVGNHRASVADPVDEDSPVAFSLCDRKGSGQDKIRQIAGFLVVRAEIHNGVSLRFQISLDLIFH